jgi:hypothetical protein
VLNIGLTPAFRRVVHWIILNYANMLGFH